MAIERTRAQEALRASEQRLRDIIEHSTNMFYSHTPDHVLTYVSPQSRQFFDCEPEEALVRWTELATDNPVNRVGLDRTERAIATGVPQPPYELELVGMLGRRVWVEVREAPVVRDGAHGGDRRVAHRHHRAQARRGGAVRERGSLQAAGRAVARRHRHPPRRQGGVLQPHGCPAARPRHGGGAARSAHPRFRAAGAPRAGREARAGGDGRRPLAAARRGEVRACGRLAGRRGGDVDAVLVRGRAGGARRLS